MAFLWHAIMVPQQAQRIDEGQIPPELRALTEDDAYVSCQFSSLQERIQFRHTHFSAARHKDTGQHLDCRAFASAIWSDEANHFSALNGEREVMHSLNFAYFGINNAPHGPK